MEQKDVTLQKLSGTFNLHIPNDVENIIRHLCNKVHNIEWSGILFYKYDGTWENDDLKITCVDILPMDIGSAGYTDFSMSADVISYMTDHDLLDCECGLSHSHHNMSTFFSGTDLKTLEKEGIDRNHFVSLIVNNAGTYTAAVTRNISVQETSFIRSKYNTFNNVEVEVDFDKKCEKEYNKIEYKELNIIQDGYDNSFQELDERLSEIKANKAAAKADKVKEVTKQPTLFDGYDEDSYYGRNFGLKNYYGGQFYGNYDDYDNDWFKIKSSNDVKIPKDYVRLVVARLLLSSMSITDINNFDFTKWANKVDSIYSKVFNSDKEMRYWLEFFCEYLIFENIPDTMLEEYDLEPDILGAFIKEEAIEFMSTLPKSDYLMTVINILEGM